MAHLAHIWRHPIKGIGSESLDRGEVAPDGALIGDRAWALLNAAAPDLDIWQARRHFLQVASGPDLAQISARCEGRIIHLTHPERPPLALDPLAEPEALAPWVTPLWPAERPPAGRLVRAPGHGMTDAEEPLISLGNLASLRDLSQRAGRSLDMRRFRLNLWVEGLEPWVEHRWTDGAELAIGSARFRVDEPVVRCRATEANPETGQRDTDVLRLLEAAGQEHNFGVYLWVKARATVQVGDAVSLT